MFIGDLLQRFGPGVSLIRPSWTPRPAPPSSGPSQTSLAQAQPGFTSEVTHGALIDFGPQKPRTRPKQRITITSPDVRRRIPRSNNGISASAVDSDSENGDNDDDDDDDDDDGGGMSSDNRQPQQTHPQALSEPKVAPIPNRMCFQNASSASSAKANEDTEMDDLALSLADTSLGFVPRGVRKKQKERGKVQQAHAARESDDLVEMG
ncbi:hypothetical protein QFC22_002429 [Naganishia vaughanmartiniae]|uniref:Uncharacterized protein n=1 Tax=Naganishia vaughanmartiniae TaxID=1424756 RepID=A0ACC2XDS6_9TREE|nr:hypothetical protein QFC22_002429 [Naganishia vaughanmartiniae]